MYSEGFYEDINKKIMLSFYAGRHEHAVDAVREWARKEISENYAEEVTAIIIDQEKTLPRIRTDETGTELNYFPKTYVWKTEPRYKLNNTEKAEDIYRRTMELNKKLDEKTQKSFRWQIIFLRSIIDRELLNNDFHPTDKCFECFEKLEKLYHVDDRALQDVRPPRRGEMKLMKSWEQGA